METIIRLKNVCETTGLGRSTIYNMVGDGSFPQPVKLTTRSTGWVASEVNDWIHDRIKASRV